MLERSALEACNKNALTLIARRHLPQDGRGRGRPRTRREAYQHWVYMIHRASKPELIDELMLYLDESILPNLEEVQELSILQNLKRYTRKKNGSSPARRKSNNKYHHNVVSPRRKAVRDYMKEHPELVEELKKKHGIT